MATNDIGRVTPIWRGFYSAATTYELNDIVIDTAGSVWWHKSEELTTGVIPEAGEIWDAVIDMSVFSALIQAAITTAQTAVQAAQEAESEVAEDVRRAETAAQSAEASAEAASESAAGVGALAQAAEQSKTEAQTAATQAAASASSAGASATSAGSSAQTAEAAKTAAQTAATQAAGSAETASGAAAVVEQKKAEALAAIETKGEEVLESIPEDYTELSGDVGDLKTQVNETNNVLTLDDAVPLSFKIYEETYSIKWADGDVAPNSDYAYTDFIDISKYGYISYKRTGTTAGATSIGMAFYDARKAEGGYISGVSSALSQSAVGYVSEPYTLAVPEGAVYARFSVYKNASTYGNFEISGYSKLLAKFGDLNTVISDDVKQIKYVQAKTILNSYVANNGSISSGDGRCRTDYIPCAQGIVVHYTGETNHSAVSALTFYDKNKKVLATHSNEGSLGTEFTATAPANTASCILSSKPTYKTNVWFESSPIFGYILQWMLDIDDFKREFGVIREDLYTKTEFSFESGYIANNVAVGQTVNTSVVSDSTYNHCTIPVQKGRVYWLTAHGGSTARAYSFTDGNYEQLEVGNDSINLTDQILIAPDDGYLICNNKVSSGEAKLYTYLPSKVTPDKTTFFDGHIQNLIDPDNIDTAFYFSPGSKKLSTPAPATYALTGLIPVEQGKTYTFSGTAMLTDGGYFAATATVTNNQASISAITFYPSASGEGMSFTVPENQNIAYVAMNLKKADGEIDGTYQLEEGVDATAIVPYGDVWKIPSKYMEEPSETIAQKISKLPRPSYAFESSKISNFIEHNAKKDKDLVIVGTGTSLTVRSNEHTTRRPDERSRPPLLNTNNFASRIWDKIMWAGQQYRRYDYAGFFTETGSFSTSYNLSDWDDKDARYGLTRYATAPASVSFEVPEGAWQFNFIFRSDTAGTETATVTIAEGNDKMEAWNGSEWVEANGYTFSMRQAVEKLTSATVLRPETEYNSATTISNYQIGGNTTYQKRLKMRCKSAIIDSRDSTKSVTISAESGRLLYWGVEWSPREFMITYINSARGSHNITYSSSVALYHFQENEIWDFKPDLIFTENPIHNSGGSGQGGMSGYYTTYWAYATDDFFFNTDNDISLASRAEANGITNLEWVIFNSSITWNFEGINEDGTLKIFEDQSGNMITALDAQTMCYQWISENEPDVIAINACKYWCDSAIAMYGDLKTATVGSGKAGNTLTDEGSHWNNNGCAVMARCMEGVFDFYN